MHRFALPLAAACLLCACGQKGNLYLPDSEREAVSTSTPAAGAASAATPAATTPGAADATAEERERENAARNNRPN